MKKVIALVSFFCLVGLSAVQAQDTNTPVVDQRQQNQRARIATGVASGELTRQEAADARGDQRRIRRAERRAKADGTVTARESARLQRKQNRASRQLRRDKHDGQQRPRAN